MSSIGIFEAKTKLSELCAQVEEAGAEYVITRRGRPVARITRVTANREAASGLLARMAQTKREHGDIDEDEADFPDVWEDRKNRHVDPLSDTPEEKKK